MIVVLALFTSCKNAASGWSPSTPKAFYNIGDVILTDGTKIDYDESRENFDEKYPIFNYALTYGTNGDTNLIGTIYENDWFVPSIAEFVLVIKFNNFLSVLFISFKF